MPRTAEDVENYLVMLERRFELEGGTYLVQSPADGSGRHDGTTVAIRVSPPIVAFRVFVAAVPADAALRLELFRRVLEYNASEMLHVSYGVDHEQLVLSGALELPNLDMNELEAMLSDIDLALARHVPSLREITRTTPSARPPVAPSDAPSETRK